MTPGIEFKSLRHPFLKIHMKQGVKMNRWFGIGNLGADPQLSKTLSGFSVLNFRIAINSRVGVKTDAGIIYKDTPRWIPIVVFGDAAEHQAKYLEKGSQIAVEGELVPRQYIDKEGVAHHTFEVQAEKITWLSRIRRHESAPSAEA